MKKFFMIAVLAVAALTASAQSKSCQEVGSISVRPYVGLSLADTNGEYEHVKVGMRPGVTAGVDAQYMLNNWFALSAGVAYSQQGFKLDNKAMTAKFDYVNVPVLANFYVCKGLALKVGLQPGYMVSEKYNMDGQEKAINLPQVNKFDLAVPVGISYEVKHFIIEARSTVGLLSWRNGGDPLRNQVCQFTVGYRF